MYQDCLDLFARMGMHIDPHEKMKNLTVAKMQMVEIIKAVSYNSSIVIMDEPTSLPDRGGGRGSVQDH